MIANNGATSALTKAGTATLILTGNNTYNGMTTVGNGTLQIGNGGGNGSLGLSDTVTAYGTLVFNLSGASTYSGLISGAGNLTQIGSGVTTLTGSSNYTGPTTISAGTLQIGSGGTGASIGTTLGVLDNGSLGFNHTDAVTFSPLISGSGSLTQAGTGTADPAGQQHLHGRHDGLRRHAADRQRQQRRVPGQSQREPGQ